MEDSFLVLKFNVKELSKLANLSEAKVVASRSVVELMDDKSKSFLGLKSKDACEHRIGSSIPPRGEVVDVALCSESLKVNVINDALSNGVCVG